MANRKRHKDTPLGRLLRRRRDELGLTQRELAERAECGITQGDISNYELGIIELPRYPVLVGLAKAVRCPLRDFFAQIEAPDLADAEIPDPAGAWRVDDPRRELADAVAALPEGQVRTLVRMARVLSLDSA